MKKKKRISNPPADFSRKHQFIQNPVQYEPWEPFSCIQEQSIENKKLIHRDSLGPTNRNNKTWEETQGTNYIWVLNSILFEQFRPNEDP